MREKHLHEDLADLAYKAESDHEVQMARAELYKVAKYAIKLHDMLKNVSEQEGLEGWVQSKITKAADYISSVYHHMDYETKFDEVQEAKKSKPDFLDVDKDGNKKEPMKKALKDKEANESSCGKKHKKKNEGTVNSVGNNQGGKVGLSSTDTAQPFSGKVGKKAPKGHVPPTQKLKSLKGEKESYKESLAAVLEAKLSKKKTVTEKAKSKAQQKFMGMVHALQKGDKVKNASPELKAVAKDMKKSDAKDFAKTKHDGLPDKVKSEATYKGQPYVSGNHGTGSAGANPPVYKGKKYQSGDAAKNPSNYKGKPYKSGDAGKSVQEKFKSDAQRKAVHAAKAEKKNEGARHGNDKSYDKCWDGYKKVPGKKRGEKGSCVKK